MSVNARIDSKRPVLRAYACGARGAATIELALGAVALMTAALLCFDLYARTRADAAIARMAATMADYVARDGSPDGDRMTTLGEYLHAQVLGVAADLVYVVSAIHKPAGSSSAAVLWTDDAIRVGDATTTTALVDECTRFVDANNDPKLPSGFTMSADEVLIVTEICARLARAGSVTGGDIYRLHVLPHREAGKTPATPTRATP